MIHPQNGLGFCLVWNCAYGHAGPGPGVNGELCILPEGGYVLIALANRDALMAANMLPSARTQGREKSPAPDQAAEER